MPLPPDPNKPIFQIMPEKYQRIVDALCVCCDNKIAETPFKDALSKKEYSISGMCQDCQDSVFGGDDDE